MLLSGGRQRIRRVFQEIERSYGVIDTLSPTSQSVTSSISANAISHAAAISPPEIASAVASAIDNGVTVAKGAAQSNTSLERLFSGLISNASSSSVVNSSSPSSVKGPSAELYNATEREILTSSKKLRKVTFHPIAQVVLIPTRHEYHDAMLGQFMWWTRKELKFFQQEARYEMRQLKRYAMYVQRFVPTSLNGSNLGGGLLSLAPPSTDSAQSSETSSPIDSLHSEIEDLSLSPA